MNIPAVPLIPLSVVIPTRDRPERLRETLLALASQDAGDGFEVIVVDDGSTWPAVALLSSLPPLPFSLRFERQSPRGPAAARNLGIRVARGARVLLLGDDTRPAPGCLHAHLDPNFATAAIQGYIEWDPEQEITPLMRFLAPAGPQFYFKGLRDGFPISYRAVLGSNFSAPRDFFLQEPYDETFAEAAGEDTELGWRWQRRRFPMVFRAGALCWHHHHYAEIDTFLRRQERAGRAARRAVQLHLRLAWALRLEPWLFLQWLRLRIFLGRKSPNDAWDLACRDAYFRGWRDLPR